MPPHDVVECVIYSSQAARGENVQVEHPICGWYSSAFHFHPTLASVWFCQVVEAETPGGTRVPLPGPAHPLVQPGGNNIPFRH